MQTFFVMRRYKTRSRARRMSPQPRRRRSAKAAIKFQQSSSKEMTTACMTTASNKDAQRSPSENPLDYLSLILYVKKNVRVCGHLCALAAARTDVLIQDVDHIQGQLPKWLTGVPTVVRIPSREVFTGTRAIEEVVAFCKEGLQGVGGLRDANATSSAAPLEGRTNEPGAPLPFDQLFTCDDIESELQSSLVDARYQDGPREKK